MASHLASIASLASLLALTALVLPACSADSAAEKTEPTDETSVMRSTSEFGLSDTRIVGSLTYGQNSATVFHAGTPRYRAFKFAGNAGDEVDVWVKSTNGDPVTWILDNDWHIVAVNDDASSNNTNSHVKAKLPANPSATHYIVVRDYWRDPMSFKVELKGGPTDFVSGCNADADCAKVNKACCENFGPTAVLGSKAGAYKASLACPDPLYCPLFLTKADFSMPQCNVATKKCELVQPKDIKCQGFTVNPHACPDNYRCIHPEPTGDVPGSCYQFCGGFGGFQCSDPNDQCHDDPSDSCDPNSGGADCGGICKP